MPAERLERLLALLAADGDMAPSTRRLAEVAAEFTGVSGAGIMLMSGGVQQGSVAVTDGVAAVIEELQYTLGEGPCIDAYQFDRPVAEADLASPDHARWSGFAPAAVAAGVAAIFGFPLRAGSVRLGALNLYRNRSGPLDDDQHADALVAADALCQALIDMQARALPGAVSVELGRNANFGYGVHQAAGMVAVQRGVSVTEALIRLRAYGFAHNQLVGAVAAEVVAGRLRFDSPGSADPI